MINVSNINDISYSLNKLMWCNGYDSIFWIEDFEFKFIFWQSSFSSDMLFGRFDELIQGRKWPLQCFPCTTWPHFPTQDVLGRKVTQAKLPKEKGNWGQLSLGI